MRTGEIVSSQVNYSCKCVFVALRREDWLEDHKRIHRICEEEIFSLRRCRPQRSRGALRRQPI